MCIYIYRERENTYTYMYIYKDLRCFRVSLPSQEKECLVLRLRACRLSRTGCRGLSVLDPMLRSMASGDAIYVCIYIYIYTHT